MLRGPPIQKKRSRASSQISRGSNQELPEAIWSDDFHEARSRTSSLNSQGSQKEVRNAKWGHGIRQVPSRTSSQTSQNTQDGDLRHSIPTGTISKLVAKTTSGTRDDSGDVPSQSIDGNDSTEVESHTKAETRKLGLAGEATNGEIKKEKQLRKYAEGFNLQPLDTKDQFSDHRSTVRCPAPANALSDIDQIETKNPVNKQMSNDVVIPKIPDSDETSNHKNEAKSDLDKQSEKTETSSKTPVPSYSNELEDIDSQSQAVESKPTLVDAGPIYGPVEGQIDPDADETQDTTETAPFPKAMESKYDDKRPKSLGPDFVESRDPRTLADMMMTEDHDVQSNSPGIIQNVSAVSRPISPWNDRTKSPDSSSQSQGPESITVETNSARDQTQEYLDTEAWLNSDAPLAGNYRAILERPRSPISISPNRSSNPASLTDSLIISPIKSDEQSTFEEEGPGASTANTEIMKVFAKYKADFPLQPLSHHQRSGTSRADSEDSLLLPPIRSDDEDLIDSEDVQDASERVKEEEAHQVARNTFELYSANFQLQKILEKTEARFNLEIKRAWAAPRPPPTTQQQRQDKLALEKMESREIFDELGDQQRPIHTDPQLVLLETQVHIMIDRARYSFLLDDFPQMYTQANRAAAAAGRLRYPPLTARCYYYRGMASYHYRDFARAKEDFADSRRCADLYGISSGRIEQYIDAIDKADDPNTAVIQHFPPQRSSGISKAKLTTANQSTEVDGGDGHSPSSTDDTSTLVDDARGNPADTDAPLSPFHSPNHKEGSTEKQREDRRSEPQPPRRHSHVSGTSSDDDPQPNIDEVPIYQPQEEAISEEIRKHILESKAQSLDAISKESPATEAATRQEKETLSPPSMASTEWTLRGSKTSQGTTRRVPRPHVQPITTSFGTAAPPVREAAPTATPVSGVEDELSEERIRRDFSTAREDATPVTAQRLGGADIRDEELL